MSGRAVLAALVFAWSLPADMVTTKDHRSVNGSVQTLANGEVQIAARYQTGNKTIVVKIEDIEVIEFNTTTYNQGPPPRSPGLAPPGAEVDSASPPAPPPPGNRVLLRGGEEKPCRVTGIDESTVHCAEASYDRRIVIRIFPGGRQ